VHHLQAPQLPVSPQQEKRDCKQPQAVGVPEVLQALQEKDSTQRNEIILHI
jgi:hypothetical protein